MIATYWCVRCYYFIEFGLDKILGIKDLRTSNRIDFVGECEV